MSKFSIELNNNTGLEIELNIDGVKDWGDGITNDLTNHTYLSYGKYIITCNGNKINTSIEKSICMPQEILTNADLEGMSIIPAYTFNNCINLQSVIIPDDITVIENNAFSNCNSLIDVILPSALSILGESAFQNCSSMITIRIPYNVVTLNNTFMDCNNLKKVIIDSQISDLRDNVFNGCFEMNECIFTNCEQVPSIDDEDVFDSSLLENNGKIIVPEKLYNNIKKDKKWTFCANIIHSNKE